MNREKYIYTTALDPLGNLTKQGVMTESGCYLFSDFENKTLMSTELSMENLKSLFSVQENGSIPARYHCATFQKKVPKLFAVNMNVDGLEGWCVEQGLAWMSYLFNGDVIAMKSQSQDVQAIARRMTVFYVAGNILSEGTIAMMEHADDAELELRNSREAAFRASRNL